MVSRPTTSDCKWTAGELRKLPPDERDAILAEAAQLAEGEYRSNPRLNEALAPVREAFQQSGLTENEAVELFEAEKHAMRREHGSAGS